MQCAFCDKEKRMVAYDDYVCGDAECKLKAKLRCSLPDFGNLAKTTFHKQPKYTAAQERRWADIAEATGFNKDGTPKV